MSIHHHAISFKHAFHGLTHGLRTQPNFRVHFLLSIIAILLSYFLQVTPMDFVIILILIGVGLAIEYLNTAIEYTVDLVVDRYHLMAKYAKDCAAAAMLIYSVFALFAAGIILLPRLFLWLSI